MGNIYSFTNNEALADEIYNMSASSFEKLGNTKNLINGTTVHLDESFNKNSPTPGFLEASNGLKAMAVYTQDETGKRTSYLVYQGTNSHSASDWLSDII